MRAPLAVVAGTAPEHVDEVLRIVAGELESLAEHGITDRELAVAKGNLRAEFLLSGEDFGARMSRLGASTCCTAKLATSTTSWVASMRSPSTKWRPKRHAGRVASHAECGGALRSGGSGCPRARDGRPVGFSHVQGRCGRRRRPDGSGGLPGRGRGGRSRTGGGGRSGPCRRVGRGHHHRRLGRHPGRGRDRDRRRLHGGRGHPGQPGHVRRGRDPRRGRDDRALRRRPRGGGANSSPARQPMRSLRPTSPSAPSCSCTSARWPHR